MKKSELRAIYREVKKNKNRRKSSSTGGQRTQGCKTCGRVTWKPYGSNQ